METQDNFRELEYKYRADNIKLTDFNLLMEEWGYEKKLDGVGSWDHYYTKDSEEDFFIRYRNDRHRPELTKKRKLKSSNNWVRVEVDLPLDPERINEEIVTRFVGLDGYKEDFKIYKSCVIYFYEYINAVLYYVSDHEMEGKQSFLEIEVNKDKLEELGDKAPEILKEYEQKLNKLGISPQNRLKKSLFEMYRKTNKEK
jgi:hypothetical protein